METFVACFFSSMVGEDENQEENVAENKSV